MKKRLVGDSEKVFRVKARQELACRVSIAHRGDYEALLRKGVVLAVDSGDGIFHLVEPVGMLCFLRKTCMRVLGSASPKTVVEADRNGFRRA